MTPRDTPAPPPDEVAAADVARFEGVTGPPAPSGFEGRLLARLEEDAEARAEATLDATFEAAAARLPAPPRASSRPATSPWRDPRAWLMALGAAAAAAIITFIATGAPAVPDEAPYAFAPTDGVLEGGGVVIERDGRGRLLAIRPEGGDGEHLLFRAGRVIRIEHRRDGRLHGVAVDLDGSGAVISVTRWEQGREGARYDLERRGASPGEGAP